MCQVELDALLELRIRDQSERQRELAVMMATIYNSQGAKPPLTAEDFLNG